MGRQKNTPKKLDPVSGPLNYIPVKKKKQKRRFNPNSHRVSFVSEDSRKFHITRECIGKCSNVIPESWKVCRASFINTKEDDDDEGKSPTLILNFDEISVLVELGIDHKFVEGIISSKTFTINLEIVEEVVYCDIYFAKLPLTDISKSVSNLIQLLFSRAYGVPYVEKVEKSKVAQTNKQLCELYTNIRNMRNEHLKLEYEELKHPRLKPTLRPYQEQAVTWMLHREKENVKNEDELHPLYMALKLTSGLEIYYNKYTGHVELDKPLVQNSIRGGILADEMGLGKTVEILACILHHPKTGKQDHTPDAQTDLNKTPVVDKISRKRKLPPDDLEEEANPPKQTIKDVNKKVNIPADWVKSSSKKSQLRVALESWYNSCLSDYTTTSRSPARNTNEVVVQCVCGKSSTRGTVSCVDCGKIQHGDCMNYKEKYAPYRCAQCWMDQPLMDSGATLIVTPVSLRTQWCNEICRHIKGDMKVLQYNGFCSSPIYPAELRDYDVVITTYSVLQSELRLTENGQVMEFRRQRKYSPPGCPLTRIKWWRLCLDEAQTVEVSSTMVSEMAKKLTADLRWAVTGTPISKEISDLYGLVDYLQIEPYNDPLTWKHLLYDPYVNKNREPMHKFLSQVLWRSSKKDVLEQINIPKQTVEEHRLTFSLIEYYFYKRLHELDRKFFLDRASKYKIDMPVHTLDRSSLDHLLYPLLSLRLACTYPNSVRSRYFATKKPVTSLKDLLEALIIKNTTENEESLRSILNSINGLAGIYLLLQNPSQAVEEYRKVLQLNSRFTVEEKTVKLIPDKLTIIHTMYNLAEVLNKYPHVVGKTLRDDSLERDRFEMEQKYIEKFISQSMTVSQSCQLVTNNIDNLRLKFVLKPAQWYGDLLNWIEIHNYTDDLMSRITNVHTDANVNCVINVAHRRDLLYIIASWDEKISDMRETAIEVVNNLYTDHPNNDSQIIIPEQIVQLATECHLRPQKGKRTSKKCPVCRANDYLKDYEFSLFTILKRSKNFEDMQLVGSWKQRSEELIFKCLLGIAKAKRAPSDILKDGDVHIQLLDTIKKEFKELRKLWTLLDQQVCALDELDICKTRLCLKNSISEDKQKNKINATLKNLDYHIENKLETVHMISEHELEYHRALLEAEEKNSMAKLEKNLGVRSYLETLKNQQFDGGSADPCPICKNVLKQHWSILPCGHSYCMECIRMLTEQTNGYHICCCVCRVNHLVSEIAFVKPGSESSDSKASVIKGDYSTKVEAVIELLANLKAKDPSVKILVFSFWASVLSHLKDALLKSNISAELITSGRLEKQIEKFKDPEQHVTALLLPIRLGSKGLNLIEATHVVLIEPLLNPSDELQAIGRVHRIGQTKPTVVHKFYIENTIEESIYKATTTNAEVWEKGKVTVGHITNLFSIDVDISETG